MPTTCIECSYSAVKDGELGGKRDKNVKAMASAGMVLCTSSPYRASFYHPTRERKCDRFKAHGDPAITERRRVFFERMSHAKVV